MPNVGEVEAYVLLEKFIDNVGNHPLGFRTTPVEILNQVFGFVRILR